MTIYLIHFETPLCHARHYLGYTDSRESLETRLARHKSGDGARLMAVVTEAEIGWSLVRTWEGDRKMERRLKNQKNGPRLCPICNPKLNKETDGCQNT